MARLRARHNAPHPALALILLGTGIYLGTVEWWRSAWFAAAVLLWLANTALAVGVLDRRAHALARLLGTTDGGFSATADALRQAIVWDWAVATMSANDPASLYVMFAKPGVTGSIVAVLVMQLAAVVAVAFSRSRRPRAAAPAAATPWSRAPAWTRLALAIVDASTDHFRKRHRPRRPVPGVAGFSVLRRLAVQRPAGRHERHLA